MELKKLGPSSYYIDIPTKVGIYRPRGQEIYLIDSGNNRDTGRKIDRLIRDNSFDLKAILNTHSHGDHIGGNKILQDRHNCKIYYRGIDRSFIDNPILQTSFFNGAYPKPVLRNKFLMAEPSKTSYLRDEDLPEGLEIIDLGGHSFSMYGFATRDGVTFLGDGLAREEVIDKYGIFVAYDIRAYLESLDFMEDLEAEIFILSHGQVLEDIKSLIKLNRDKIYTIIEDILGICIRPISFQDLLKAIFESYGLKMDLIQNVLIANTLRSYLSYMLDEGLIGEEIKDNILLYKKL